MYTFVLTCVYWLRSQYDLLALFVILASWRYEFCVAVANTLSVIAATVWTAEESIGRGVHGRVEEKNTESAEQRTARGREKGSSCGGAKKGSLYYNNTIQH